MSSDCSCTETCNLANTTSVFLTDKPAAVPAARADCLHDDGFTSEVTECLLDHARKTMTQWEERSKVGLLKWRDDDRPAPDSIVRTTARVRARLNSSLGHLFHSSPSSFPAPRLPGYLPQHANVPLPPSPHPPLPHSPAWVPARPAPGVWPPSIASPSVCTSAALSGTAQHQTNSARARRGTPSVCGVACARSQRGGLRAGAHEPRTCWCCYVRTATDTARRASATHGL